LQSNSWSRSHVRKRPIKTNMKDTQILKTQKAIKDHAMRGIQY